MARVRLLRLTPLVALGIPWIAAAAQDARAGQGARVEVGVTPATVLPGRRVTINGTADLDAHAAAIRIEIARPAASGPDVLTTTADSLGQFSAGYDRTTVDGRYRVTAYSPSGRARDTTSFTVASASSATGDIDREVEADLTAADAALGDVADLVAELPASPPRDELARRLAGVQERARALREQMPVVADAFDKLGEMLQRAPASAAPVAKYVDQLQRWQESSAEQRAHQSKLAREGTYCEQLDRVNEGLGFASLLFDLVGTPIEIVNNIFYDKVATDALSGVAGVENENAKFAISQFLKVGVVAGARGVSQHRLGETVSLDGTITGILGDVTQFVVQKLFGASCERFIGTFTARLDAEFSRDLAPWWRYDEEVSGVLDLRYPKATGAAGPIPMTGEFLGVATRFGVWEDAVRVLFPKLDAYATTFHVRRIPAATPFSTTMLKMGKVAFALLPKSFNIPVTAEYGHDRITIHLQPAASDLDEHAHVVYVFLSALALFPVVNSADLPYKDAHFILSHAGLGGSIELPVSSADGKLFVASSSVRTMTGEGTAARGSYRITINVCNPSCPQGGPSP